jgi:uroporphyrinogen-III synthase
MGMARQSSASPASASPVPILLTRPESEAKGFAAALVQRFGGRVRPVIAPLMAVEYLTPAIPPGRFAGVVFTSAFGVEGARRLAADWPALAWCVGARTAERAREAGFQARSADGDADALVAAILADPPEGRLVHLRGEDTRGEVSERLTAAGVETEAVVVYRQAPCPLTAEGRRLLLTDGAVIVPLFSPRSAGLFATEAQGARADLHLVAMSRAVADAVQAVPRRSLTLAPRPEAEAMLEGVAAALRLAGVP